MPVNNVTSDRSRATLFEVPSGSVAVHLDQSLLDEPSEALRTTALRLRVAKDDLECHGRSNAL
jgi:hypothetical protein